MINDVFAPVVKTLFIPEGNPGVQEVKEIRAVPRVIQAEGDAQEITVSGEMDLHIIYVPINEADDEIPWRTIQFAEKDDMGQFENEEQVLARLESALKDDQEEEEDPSEECLKIEISVPFTLAIGTEGFCRNHIIKLDPCIHSSNWFLVSPTAIEFEAVLKLAPQEETAQFEIEGEEEWREVEILENEQKQVEPQPLACFREEEKTEPAVPVVKPVAQSVVKPVVKPLVKETVKPAVKEMVKPREDRHDILISKYYFQMKFYRVQLGEDLDAIADRFGISREKISSLNSINEEEIRTGLLLSIPKN